MKKLLYILLFVPLALFGQDNYSLSFDGVNDYVNLGYADEFEFLNNNFSVSTWIKQDSPKTSYIVSNYYCYGDYPLWVFRIDQVENSSYLGYEVRPTASSSYGTTNIADGNWHYVSLIRSGINYSIFLDGELEISVDINNNPVSNNIPNQYTVIGCELTQCGVPNHFFNGLMSKFKIWDKALTQEEIQSYMTCPPTGNEEGIVGYWNFNEGSGDTVYDLSGNGNHGTINGANYSNDVPEQNCFIEEFSNLNQIDGFSYGGFYDSSYYFLSEAPDTWLNSDSVCASLGGNLVVIETEEENQFIIDSLNITSPGIWLGLYQNIYSENYSEPNGGWEWVNGLPLNFNDGLWSSYQNWNTGEPNHANVNGETYANMWFQANSNEPSGTWNDWINTANWNDAPGVNNGINYVLEISAIYGCLNPEYYNYNPQANTSDDSCMMYEEFLIDSLQQALAVFEPIQEAQDYSLSFDGIDDYVVLGSTDLLNAEDDFSVSFSIKNPTTTYSTGIGAIFWHANNGQFQFNYDVTTNTVRFCIKDYDLQWNIIEIINPSDDWVSYTGTYSFDNKEMKFYCNGILGGSLIIANNILHSDIYHPNIHIGALLSGGVGNEVEQYSGLIDDVILWQRTLSESEIADNIMCNVNTNDQTLIGYWKFNEGDLDEVYDITGNVSPGIINGATFSEDVPESYNGCTNENALNFDAEALCDNGSCVYGDEVVSNLEEDLSVFETVEEEQEYSMSFDGVDDYVEINSSPLFSISNTGSFTIQFRLKMFEGGYVITHYQNLDASNSNFAIGVNNNFSSISIFGNGTNSVIFDTNINDTLYHNAVLIFNESQVSVYLDGGYIGTESINLNNSIINYPLIIGNLLGDYGNPMTSNVSEISLFDFAISSDDISSYFNCLIGEETGLVGYWNFNVGSGDTIYDLSGNGNHGVIYGAEFSEDVPESYNGCTDESALNFDESALCDNGSCVFADDVVSNLEGSFNQTVSGLNNELDSTNSTLNDVIDTWQTSINLTNESLDAISGITQTLSSFNSVIDLTEGWNMIGYGCPNPIDVAEALGLYTDLVLICKDNNGSAYLPEYGFNGIGDFTPGFGYQLKISESIEGFSLCGEFSAIDNTQITAIEDNNAQMQNDINCLTGNPEIGDHCYGGIVFYVDETGQHGLVVAPEYIGQYYHICDWSSLSQPMPCGLYSKNIGDGLSNTNAIVDCCPDFESAASACLNYELDGYYDWYLPSYFELIELRSNLDILPLEMSGIFWSSSTSNVSPAYVDFTISDQGGAHTNELYNVIPIRSF